MDNKNVNKDVELNKNLLDDEKIYAVEDEEIVMNCEGQPCNFTYFKE
ncbi:MAG: hypothetical protein ABF633_09460 [Clostridium sp.]